MTSKTEIAPAYAAALEAALAELTELKRATQIHRRELNATQRRIVELRSAIHNLIKLIPEKHQVEWKERLRPANADVLTERKTCTPEYKEMLYLVLSEPEKQWKAEDIERKLLERGFNPKAKTIYNALNRLAHQGKLVRVRRGVYRSQEYSFGVVTSDELSEKKD